MTSDTKITFIILYAIYIYYILFMYYIKFIKYIHRSARKTNIKMYLISYYLLNNSYLLVVTYYLNYNLLLW